MIVTAHTLPNTDASGRSDEFTRLFTAHRGGVLAYILAMVPRRGDAEEIFQATVAQLWQEFHRFEQGTEFGAWASRVAYFQVLSFRKRRSRERLQFTPDFVDRVAVEAAALVGPLDDRQAALERCLEKLSPRQRKLIELRYRRGVAIENIALQVGRSVEATYKALSRIRQLLHDCVRRVRGLEEGNS